MSTHNMGPNRTTEYCHNCGEELNPGQGTTYERWGYPWNGSDTEGSVQVCQDRYTVCMMATDCARRVVERGSDIWALRQVAADYENLGDLATQARAILGEWRDTMQAIARGEDMAAREDGYGAIGGCRGR